MKSISYLMFILFMLGAALTSNAQPNQAASDFSQKELNVTVYNSNLGVVRDIRTMSLKSGISDIKITDVPTGIDPTSVHANLNGSVLEQNYQYDLVNMHKILEKYIDHTITLKKASSTITGTLLSAGNNLVLKLADGSLMMIPDIKEYEIVASELPEGLITRPTLIWNINAKKSGIQDIDISYHTSGLNWHAEYVAILNEDDTEMDLNAWVSVANHSGKTYKKANLKLVAGDVNRVSPASGDLTGGYPMVEARRAGMIADDKSFQEKAFFEYHIYNLERKTTLANNETKQINLFNASDVKINKKYFYMSNGSIDNGKAKVIVEFVNEEKNNLGMPFPKGKVRVNKSDGESIEFVGEDRVDHTPRKEKIKLNIGEAFDVVIDEKETNYRQISKKVSERNHELTVKNRKEDDDITLDVERFIGRYGEITKCSIEYKKEDSEKISFKVKVKKDSEVVVKYTVRLVFK
jgi:hypothetical protein